MRGREHADLDHDRSRAAVLKRMHGWRADHPETCAAAGCRSRASVLRDARTPLCRFHAKPPGRDPGQLLEWHRDVMTAR
jgi:hypothetical protein